MASTVYALKCKNGKYYVGKTTDVRMRVGQHCEGDGSVWTSMHEPISVAYVKHGCDPFDEDKITKQFMAKYGIDSVRGGSYAQVTIEPHVKKLIETELASANDACFRCGRRGHFASSCFAKTHANGVPLSSPGFGRRPPATTPETDSDSEWETDSEQDEPAPKIVPPRKESPRFNPGSGSCCGNHCRTNFHGECMTIRCVRIISVCDPNDPGRQIECEVINPFGKTIAEKVGAPWAGEVPDWSRRDAKNPNLWKRRDEQEPARTPQRTQLCGRSRLLQ